MGAEQRYDGTHNVRHSPSRSKAKHLDPIINIIPGKQRIEGQVTSQGYLITVGPSEQQSGPHESGPENRVVQKQDEETILPDSLDPYGQD